MKTIVNELALVFSLIWLWLGLSACRMASKAAPLITQTALPPVAVGQPAEAESLSFLSDEYNPIGCCLGS